MVRFRGPVVICVGAVCLGVCAWVVIGRVLAANTMRSYENQAAAAFLFEQRPFHFQCLDRPYRLPPGEHSWIGTSDMAPFARTRLDRVKLPLAEVPALTIASDTSSYLHVGGGSQEDWELQFCATGDGDNEAEAHHYLDGVSMVRTGSLISLSAEHPRGRTGGHGDLVAWVPSEAPLTIHTMGPIEVRNLSGPVRISAANARATILNTTGTVDADGGVVDFSGGRGRVMLNSYMEINIKLTGPRFLGGLSAYSQRAVRVLVPHGFESPIEVMVNSKKDLICRADFCSRMKEESKSGAYIIKKYADNSEAALDHVWFRSDHSIVVIDNWPQSTFPQPSR